MGDGKQVIVKVKRQAGPKQPARWEEFSLKWRPSMNVIICLRDIAESPVTRDGKKTTPITYDSNCLKKLRLLRHAHQRESSHGLFRAGDQLDQPIRIERCRNFRWCAILPWIASSCSKA